MAKLSILTDRCKGCGLCVAFCPKKILTLNSDELNSGGYTPVTVTDMSACIGCGTCYRICPDCVITIEK